VQPAEIAPREIVFVIDRSGSQSGRPLEKARETMLWMLDRLNPNDTFQIVSFSNQSEQLFAEPQQVTRASLTAARAYIAGLQANGGTFMADAVQRICAAPASAHRLRIVTFMTDGYVGDDDQILDLVQRLRGTSRWFPFGTGNSVNRYLLDGMAKQGGGEVEYVLLNESGERVARKFYERIAEPLLTDVSVEMRGLDVVDVLPSQHADVWAEKPLVIHARYRAAGRGRVVLRGYRAGKPYEQTLDVALPERRSQGAALASMWARAKVESIEAKDLGGLQRGSFDQKLREEIETVALAHKLVTRFTSFVAVDESARVNGEAVLVPVPVEMPQGVEYEGIYGAPALARMRSGPPQAQSPMPAVEQAEPADSSAHDSRLQVAPTRPKPVATPQLGLEKLDTTLAALVAGRADARPLLDGDGRLRVRIDVQRVDNVVLGALAKAGFKLASVDVRGPTLVGTLTLEELKKVVALDVVKQVGFDWPRR
jgi:Ca-activated chloride channel family protein